MLSVNTILEIEGSAFAMLWPLYKNPIINHFYFSGDLTTVVVQKKINIPLKHQQSFLFWFMFMSMILYTPSHGCHQIDDAKASTFSMWHFYLMSELNNFYINNQQ